MIATTDDFNKLQCDDDNESGRAMTGRSMYYKAILTGPKRRSSCWSARRSKPRWATSTSGRTCAPIGFDGKSSEAFKAWELEVVNYLGSDENNHVEEILESASKLKDKISTEIYNVEADEKDLDPDNNMTHHKFSKQLYRCLMCRDDRCSQPHRPEWRCGQRCPDAWRRLSVPLRAQLGFDHPVPLESYPGYPSGKGCHRSRVQRAEARRPHPTLRESQQQGPRRRTQSTAHVRHPTLHHRAALCARTPRQGADFR